MRASVLRVAAHHGVGSEGLELLGRAHDLAMEPRWVHLEDEHHPEYLHPGRCALILVRDADVVDSALLAGAMLLESWHPEMQADAGALDEPRVSALLEALPDAAHPRRVEELVAASGEARLVAVAEHLDHLRHLHMLPPTPQWSEHLAQAEALWGPLAHRTHPLLARRYERWMVAFRRKVARQFSGGG